MHSEYLTTYILTLIKRLDQQSRNTPPSYARHNTGTYLRHEKRPENRNPKPISSPIPPPISTVPPPVVATSAPVNSNPPPPQQSPIVLDSPKSILKKKSAYEIAKSKPAPAAEIVRPSSVTNEIENDQNDLKSVNVAQARQMFGGRVNAAAPPPKSPKPQNIPPPKPVENVPPPKPVESIPPEIPKIIESDDHQELDWEDEFDLVRDTERNFEPKRQPEDYVSDSEGDNIPAYDLQPMGSKTQAQFMPGTREPWSESEESLDVDGDVLGALGETTYAKQADPDTQSLLSQQSITLTDSNDLKNLALKHFSESKSDSEPEVEETKPVKRPEKSKIPVKITEPAQVSEKSPKPASRSEPPKVEKTSKAVEKSIPVQKSEPVKSSKPEKKSVKSTKSEPKKVSKPENKTAPVRELKSEPAPVKPVPAARNKSKSPRLVPSLEI